ncbi:MAG TPA: pentapeptide repeat-containing protein [Dehalococcoidia bacterium]|nr:pentapeptide repeat-containing protein [Dehalococcoidia bacterium]
MNFNSLILHMIKNMIILLLLSSTIYSQQCNKNNWKDYYNKESKDMTGCNLREENLAGVDLKGAILVDSDLFKANLQDANLEKTELLYTNLIGVNLQGANLAKADLEESSLIYADLSGSNLIGANLMYVDLRDADLTGANLRKTNLAEAKLKGSDITGVKSGEITGEPSSLPVGWNLVDGQLIQNE